LNYGVVRLNELLGSMKESADFENDVFTKLVLKLETKLYCCYKK